MALLHDARLVPTKIEALSAWVPTQPWLSGADASSLQVVGAYRFDDPAGRVGIETHLLRTADGVVLQVPLTYRPEPLPGAASALVTTMEHSVLGQRWVYDGCVDPVYALALATTILGGGHEAELLFEGPGGAVRREPTVRVRGSGSGSENPWDGPATTTDVGSTTVLATTSGRLTVRRRPDSHPAPEATATLTGTWAGQSEPVVLAFASSSRVGGRRPAGR